MAWVSADGVFISLQPFRLRNLGSIPSSSIKKSIFFSKASIRCPVFTWSVSSEWTGDSYTGVKVAGAWSWPLTSMYVSKLRVIEPTPSPSYALMTWAGTTLTFYLLLGATSLKTVIFNLKPLHVDCCNLRHFWVSDCSYWWKGNRPLDPTNPGDVPHLN